MSRLARRRDGWNSTRTLSGAAARRLLDGSDDGPSPLPQLLAAATAPGTAADLQGEEAARAAFRSSVHATSVPLGGPRRARAKAATTILAAKIIAAIALTAGGAGGVAVATNSYSADLQQDPAVSRTDTATVRVVSPSGTTTSTTAPSMQAPDGATGSDSSTSRGEEAADTVPSPGSEVRPPNPTGRSGQPDRSADDPQAGNGNKSAEKNTSNGNASAKETKTNNGKKPDQGEKTNNGKKPEKGNSKNATNPGQSKKDSDQSSSDSRHTGADKGPAKKNAETTPAT